MVFFKLKNSLNINNTFNKILYHRNIDSDMMSASEINFLQTPSSDNIHKFCQLLSDIYFSKVFTFFHHLKNITENIEEINKKTKIKLFSEILLLQYIEYTIEKNKDNCISNEFFLNVLSIAEKYKLNNQLKIKILEKYDQHSDEATTPFFIESNINKLKEELNYA